ncbi:MAG: Holliday junction branch migration DNA helicase RuvB [Bacilli bacterium]|nr:Holliday junction branch migration DNA helicase RuvB [Bacilli bacterium]MDD4076734.1 Holliday junction branch migration DNA helicase RuvB [Bacilli bacterium]MDD4387836.1 Holliday junction branch migration DNA helicase RuvB [Bacilli bacterium]
MENNDITLQEYDLSLRPKRLNEYIGQEAIKEMLNVFITSALTREETLDHVLLYGPPGLGKTTLAHIIANEMNSHIYSITAPSLDRVGDLVAILSNLDEGDFLFIDEIHRLPRVVEEVLYSAMEDYVVNVVVGKDATANTIKIVLPPFTLIGATTRCGDITAPLRDRFGIVHQINYYPAGEIVEIVKRTSKVFNFDIDEDAAWEIAKRSRGTPRIANRLFRRVRDFAQFDEPDCQKITFGVTATALTKLNIDEAGLNETDHRYLLMMIEKFNGGPVGLNTLGAAISEDLTTLEDVYEPYLLQEGFIIRTPRGRVATRKAYQHLGIDYEG